MKSKDELIKAYTPHGLFRGGELYLHYAKGLEFIDECSRNGLGILGIEGFTYSPSDNGITAHLDMIADLSEARRKVPEWGQRVDYCRKASLDFFQSLAGEGKRLDQYHFNFVVASKEDW